jgi:hypothetical protein
MQALAAASVLLVVGISVLIGARLVALWGRTRALPELLLGAMLLLTAGIGYPGQIIATRIEGAAVVPLYLLAYVAVSAGVALLYLFTWRVFRAQERWALAFACAGATALAFNVVARARQVMVAGDIDIGPEALAACLFQGVTVAVAYVWTAWESLRHYGMMKRRIRLGLADPALANRFLLWGTMALCSSAGTVSNVVAVGMRVDVMNDPGILLFSSASALGQAVPMFLALMPPLWYLERIRSRAEAVPQGS